MKRTALLGVLAAVVVVILTVAQVRGMRNPHATASGSTAPAARPQVRLAAEGRLVAYPGAEVTVSSDSAGTIESLLVKEKDVVRKGDVMAVVKADDTLAALSEARSRVGESKADIRLFDTERKRARQLFEQEVGSKQLWDKAQRDLEAAQARLSSTAAEVRRLQALVEKNVIRAPISGTVVARFVDAGERITDGDPVITLADLSRTRVEAEVDEFDIARVGMDAQVTVTAEGFTKQWSGRVEEIPDAVISRRLNPQDPSKPIDTRVLLVKVALEQPTPLKLGQRVEVQIVSENK